MAPGAASRANSGSASRAPAPVWRPLRLLALVVSILAVPAAASQAGGPGGSDRGAQVRVEVRDGLASLDARNASLETVMTRLGAAAGFRAVAHGPLEASVNLSLKEIPVEDLVTWLARDTFYIVHHESSQDPPRLSEVHLYPPEPAGPSPASAGRPQSGRDPTLLADLSDADTKVRILAVHELARAKEGSAADLLASVLREDQNPLVRGQAAMALGEAGGIDAVADLVQALEDEDQAVRLQAVRALGRVGGAVAARALGDLLLHESDRRLRRSAAWSLGRIDSPSARSYLEAAAKDPDAAISQTARQSLGRRDDVAEEGD